MAYSNRIQLFGYDGQVVQQFTERDVSELGPYADGITALAMGPGGILHVGYRSGDRIRQFGTAGGNLTFVRSFGDAATGAVSDLTVMPDGTVFVVSGQGAPYTSSVISKFSNTGSLLSRWSVGSYCFQSIDNDGTSLYVGGYDRYRIWIVRKYTAAFAQIWQKVPAIVIAPGNPYPNMSIPSLEVNTDSNYLTVLQDTYHTTSIGQVGSSYYTSTIMTLAPGNGAYGSVTTSLTAYGGMPRFLAHNADGAGEVFVEINNITGNRIYRYTSGLIYQTNFVPTGMGFGRISTGLGMCAGTAGLWVADYTRAIDLSTDIDELFGFQHVANSNYADTQLNHALSPLGDEWEASTVLAANGEKPGIKVLPDGRLRAVYADASTGVTTTRYSRDLGKTWGAS